MQFLTIIDSATSTTHIQLVPSHLQNAQAEEVETYIEDELNIRMSDANWQIADNLFINIDQHP